MSLQSCWTSLSCLQFWEPYTKWFPGFAAAFVIVGVIVSHLVTKQIAFLKAPRSLSAEQSSTISSALKDKHNAEFQVTSWADSEESASFGGQLHKALRDAGWHSRGMTRYYMDEGEAAPTGVNVIVDGLNLESLKSAQNLVECLRASGIQDVKFSTKMPKPMSSAWVLVEVGRKPNL